MSVHGDLIKIHGSNKNLSKQNGEVIRKRSLSDISGEFCVESLDCVDFWNENLKTRKSSINSNFSERPESRISLDSNVSGFEDEIDALRDLLRNPINNNNNNVGCKNNCEGDGNSRFAYPTISENSELSRRIIDLNNELVKQRNEVEKLNFFLIEKECTIKKHQEREKLFNTISEQLQNVEDEKHKIEAHNRELQIQNNDQKLQIDCKDSAIIGLKDKIREQFCELEEIRMQLNNYESSNSILKDELEIIKKSESWFRDEFHLCQKMKTTLQERIIALENENLKIKSRSERLQTDLRLLASTSEDIEMKAKRDKENLMQKLIEIGIREEHNSNKIKNEIILKNDNFDQTLEVNEIKYELDQLKHKFEQQLKHYITLEKENTKLLNDLSVSNENRVKSDLTQKMYEETINQLNSKCTSYSSILVTNNQDKIELINENYQLKVDLENVQAEKTKIDQIIQKLRSDFDTISKRYLNMKHEVLVKASEIKDLKDINNELEEKIIEINNKSLERDNIVESLNASIIKLEESQKCHIETMNKTTNTDETFMFSKLSPKHQDAPIKDTDQSDIQKLKTLIRVIENEHKTKLKRYEINTRTLLKKVKEHMRAQKIAEKKCETLTLLTKENTGNQIKYDELTVTHSQLEFAHKKIHVEYSQLTTEYRELLTQLYCLYPSTKESNLKNLVNATIADVIDLRKTNSELSECQKMLQQQNEQLSLENIAMESMRKNLKAAEDEISNLMSKNTQLCDDIEAKIRGDIDVRDKLKVKNLFIKLQYNRHNLLLSRIISQFVTSTTRWF